MKITRDHAVGCLVGFLLCLALHLAIDFPFEVAAVAAVLMLFVAVLALLKSWDKIT